jgi:hypothetical protein
LSNPFHALFFTGFGRLQRRYFWGFGLSTIYGLKNGAIIERGLGFDVDLRIGRVKRGKFCRFLVKRWVEARFWEEIGGGDFGTFFRLGRAGRAGRESGGCALFQQALVI